MEGIHGNHAYEITPAMLAGRLAVCQGVLVDIGTGDGRYVQHIARTCPTWLGIGIDACRENLRQTARKSPGNALYIIANALALPHELAGVATRITINFPWGSLLDGLLAGTPALLDGLATIARPGALVEVRLNGGALAEAGWSLDGGGEQVRRMLRDGGFAVRPPAVMDAPALRACPTTWARRLAFGRDPRALYLRAARPAAAVTSTARPQHVRVRS